MTTHSKPADQRPEHPDFWCKRFGEGSTPWDAGCIPEDFRTFVASQPHPLNTLIPGCGSAWEAKLLGTQNWPVTALDFSPGAIARAKEILGADPVDLVCADFFRWQPTQALQLIYERAFLCALPRKLWADWGQKIADLLPSGSELVGYFFICEQLKGPPFGIEATQLNELLSPHFRCEEDRPVQDSIPVFSGRERWQRWRRR